MASLEIGTSTSNPYGGQYQVFLSFRGPDTRRGFTSYLYHALVDVGICVFIDDEELRPGERISGNLLQAIDDSKLYIPIFSKNYAKSHWCLRELAKMVENTSKSKEDGKEKFILPIFYDVKPEDVKLKTSLYTEAISDLEVQKKFSSEDVMTLRKAFEEVGGTKGWEQEKYNKGYGDLIKSVVNEVMVRLKTRQRQVTEDLVGMEDRIAAINNLLDIDSGGVRLIGIYGMGGIGKTTLTKIKGSVQALHLKGFQPLITITSEQIKRFPHLRFLWSFNVICQGDFTGCLSELKWIKLSCHLAQCLEATNLSQLENAVVVNLSKLDITEDGFESLIKGATKLKVLTIQDNVSIHGIPTFPEDSVLEKLTISNFSSLTEIDRSIGKLRRLTDLTFEYCANLKKLPDQIGELQELRHLSLRGCRSLSELPDSILKLKSLTKLDVSSTAIRRLPDKIGRLPSLSYADVSYAGILELPSTMSKFRQLQTLDLRCCNGIQELPKLPRSLTTLRLRSASLLTVPNLSYLTNLVELELSDGSDVFEGRSDIMPAGDLQWIGRLSKLSKLHVCFPSVRAPTTGLGSLSLLKELTLYGLDLPTFQQLPPNLIVLELYDTRGKQVNLDGLPQLEKETDPRGKQVHLDELPQSEKETAFDSTSSGNSRENENKRLVCPPKEPGSNELQAPELIDQRRGAFLFPSSQKMLQKFLLSGFLEVQDIQFASAFESLEEFSVEKCSSLKSLRGLSNLKNLKKLVIRSCESLQVVEGIDELEFLHSLRIQGCRSMEMIFDASNSKMPNQCGISITGSGKLRDSGPYIFTWEPYREKILNGTKQALDLEIETTDSETETLGSSTENEPGKRREQKREQDRVGKRPRK